MKRGLRYVYEPLTITASTKFLRRKHSELPDNLSIMYSALEGGGGYG